MGFLTGPAEIGTGATVDVFERIDLHGIYIWGLLNIIRHNIEIDSPINYSIIANIVIV